MAKVKDENKLQIQLKIDRFKDREIFDILNVSDNKSDFIKDALFYFVYHIEQGKVINRNYPYNKVNIKLDIIEDSEDDINTNDNCIEQQDLDNKNNKSSIDIKNDDTYEDDSDDYEEDEYDDNFDDVDI